MLGLLEAWSVMLYHPRVWWLFHGIVGRLPGTQSKSQLDQSLPGLVRVLASVTSNVGG